MKIFVISTALLVVTAMGILFNCLYINKVGTEMKQRLEALPSECGAALSETEALLERWEDVQRWVSFSAHRLLVDRVSEQALALESAARCGDTYGYLSARSLLSDALDDLMRPEGLRGVLLIRSDLP